MQAQKKKLGKKKSAEKGVSPSADGEKGVAPSPHKLLKKFDQNFYPLSKVVGFVYNFKFFLEGVTQWKESSGKEWRQ